jgi:hypothetical protein
MAIADNVRVRYQDGPDPRRGAALRRSNVLSRGARAPVLVARHVRHRVGARAHGGHGAAGTATRHRVESSRGRATAATESRSWCAYRTNLVNAQRQAQDEPCGVELGDLPLIPRVGPERQADIQYCGQAMDPTTAEGFRIDVAPLARVAIGSEEREGARLPRSRSSPAPSDAQQSRIQIGVVSFDLTVGNPAPEIQRETRLDRDSEPVPSGHAGGSEQRRDAATMRRRSTSGSSVQPLPTPDDGRSHRETPFCSGHRARARFGHSPRAAYGGARERARRGGALRHGADGRGCCGAVHRARSWMRAFRPRLLYWARLVSWSAVAGGNGVVAR